VEPGTWLEIAEDEAIQTWPATTPTSLIPSTLHSWLSLVKMAVVVVVDQADSHETAKTALLHSAREAPEAVVAAAVGLRRSSSSTRKTRTSR